MDILITSAKKDLNKIKYLYESLINIKDHIDNIYCICSELPIDKISDIKYYIDDDIIDFDFSKFKYRPNWIKQQFFKLFQQVTSDNYLVLDSDIYINKDIQIISDKPSFFIGVDQYHLPYFNYSKKMFNIDKSFNYSFISEIMYFERKYIKKMINNLPISDILNKSVDIINNNCYISEFELYGNYMYKYYPDEYHIKKINTFLNGKSSEWLDNDMKMLINNMKKTNYDIISYHTWKV